jgi:hypothetical protein
MATHDDVVVNFLAAFDPDHVALANFRIKHNGSDVPDERVFDVINYI